MAIEGKIEAIKSPNSTPDKEIITIPFSTANAVYFPDGTTLLNKYTNGELGSGSGSSSGSSSASYVPNKWYGKNLVCLGDSITAGGYPNYIKEVLGCQLSNKGSSGGTYDRDFNQIINTIDWKYVDVVTYDQAGKNLYYANQYGVMEKKGWFNFSDEQGGGIGYANPDGKLLTNQFSKDEYGRLVYFQANGKLAKGLMTDGVTYYQMDEIDGHCIGQFPVN